MEIFKIVTLALSGLLLFMVGIMRMSNPIQSYAKNSGINLDNNVDLLNEMRGVGALMFCAGAIVLLGTFMSTMSFTSFVVGALVFVGFGIGRVTGMMADGKPNKQIVQGLVFEVVFGALNVICLVNALV